MNTDKISPKPGDAQRAPAAHTLDAWARFSQRAPLYIPGPDDYSKAQGPSANYTDDDELPWRIVEDELVRLGAGGPLGRSHPLRKLLHWVHDDDGRPTSSRAPERFAWPLPGFTLAEVRYLLGMPPGMRARGDYEEFVRNLGRKLTKSNV